MEIDNPPSRSGTKSNKRSFIEALCEFSQQTQQTPASKQVNVDPSLTNTIRIEISKVPFVYCLKYTFLSASHY